MKFRAEQLWTPHNLSLAAAGTPVRQNSQLAGSCTLLRVPCSVADAEAAVVCSPLMLPARLLQLSPTEQPQESPRLLFSNLPAAPALTHRSKDGGSADEVCQAPQTTWLVLEVNTDFAADASTVIWHRGWSYSSRRGERHVFAVNARRLCLGAVLHASTWQCLFTRQRGTVAGSAACGDRTCAERIDATCPSGAATAADREAFAFLFPAFHGGFYFATQHEFAHHCRCSDVHLLWCENEPLLTVEWTSERKERAAVVMAKANAQALAAHGGDGDEKGQYGTDVSGAAKCSLPESLTSSRKRRRSWLAGLHGPQRRRACFGLSAAAAEERTAISATLCAYELSMRLLQAETPATANTPHLPPPSPQQPTAVMAQLETDQMAAWYCVLCPACHASRTSVTKIVTLFDGSDNVPPRHRAAAVELLFHGLLSSLALWCSTHGSDVCHSTLNNTETFAALLLQWWSKLVEAAACSAAQLLSGEETAERRRMALCAASLFPSPLLLTGPLAAFNPIRSEDEALPDRATAQLRFQTATPSFLARLAVDCAVAATRHQRWQDRKQCWSGTRAPPSMQPHAAEFEERRATPLQSGITALSRECSEPGVGKPTSTTTAVLSGPAMTRSNVPLRLSQEEGKQCREHYEACMDLVLQLLVAEQQALLTTAAEPAQ